MTSLFRVFAAILLFAFAAGCGQSGPLYIPGDPSTVQTPPQQPQDDEEDDESEAAGRP